VLYSGEPYLIAKFRQRAGIHLNKNELELARTVWGTVVLMQHYGAPTRLLDWTYSPWVAAYFAAASEKAEDGFIYGFRRATLKNRLEDIPRRVGAPDFQLLVQEKKLKEWQWMMSGKDEEPERQEWLIALQPSRAPARLDTQQALFSLGNPIGLDHRAWLGRNLEREAKKVIVVSGDLKPSVMRTLERMNITGASLFPDLGGAARSLNDALYAEATMVATVDDWATFMDSPSPVDLT